MMSEQQEYKGPTYPTEAEGLIPAFHSYEEGANWWDTHDIDGNLLPDEEEIQVSLNIYCIIERAATNYSAYSPQVPGCMAVGDTRGETVALMKEALQEHLQLEYDDERKWDAIVRQPRVQEGTRHMVEESHEEYLRGETEEGGFGIESRSTMYIDWSDEDQAYLVTLPGWADKVIQPVTHGSTYVEAAQRGQEVLAMLLRKEEIRDMD